MTWARSAFLLAALVLCGHPANGQELRVQVFGFERDAPKALPDAFETGMTGEWKATEWSVRRVDGNNARAANAGRRNTWS